MNIIAIVQQYILLDITTRKSYRYSREVTLSLVGTCMYACKSNGIRGNAFLLRSKHAMNNNREKTYDE